MKNQKRHLSVLVLFLSLNFLVTGSLFAEAISKDISDTMREAGDKAPEPKMVAVDTNKDAKADRWEYHEGNKVRVEADTNFDNKVDEVAYFENGKLIKGEKDSDYDGKMDKWINY